MAVDDRPDVRERMEQLKALEDARRLTEDRAETVRLAQRVQDTRLVLAMHKDRAKQAKLEHELAQWDLEAHAGVQLDEAEMKRRNKARQQLLPGMATGDEDEDG